MRNLKLHVLALSLTALVGCKAIDAMDNTEDMKKDLKDMKSTTGDMAGTTDEMNKQMKRLENKTAAGISLDHLTREGNQTEFSPPSEGLLAGAKLAAENMTADELLDYFLASLKVVRQTKPNDEVELRPALISKYRRNYIASFNRHKQVKVVALQAIAAQIPQETIEKIVLEQLLGKGGARADEAKQMLMLRAMFINNFFLENSVFGAGVKIDNVGKLENAHKYASQLQFLADLPMRESIKFSVDKEAFIATITPAVKKPGEEGCKTDEEMENNADCKETSVAPSFNETLDSQIAKPWFKKILKRVKTELPADYRDSYAHDVAKIVEDCERQTAN